MKWTLIWTWTGKLSGFLEIINEQCTFQALLFKRRWFSRVKLRSEYQSSIELWRIQSQRGEREWVRCVNSFTWILMSWSSHVISGRVKIMKVSFAFSHENIPRRFCVKSVSMLLKLPDTLCMSWKQNIGLVKNFMKSIYNNAINSNVGTWASTATFSGKAKGIYYR